MAAVAWRAVKQQVARHKEINRLIRIYGLWLRLEGAGSVSHEMNHGFLSMVWKLWSQLRESRRKRQAKNQEKSKNLSQKNGVRKMRKRMGFTRIRTKGREGAARMECRKFKKKRPG